MIKEETVKQQIARDLTEGIYILKAMMEEAPEGEINTITPFEHYTLMIEMTKMAQIERWKRWGQK